MRRDVPFKIGIAAAMLSAVIFIATPFAGVAAAAEPIIMGAVRSNLYQVSANEFAQIEKAVKEGPFQTLRNRLATSLTLETIPRDAQRNAERMAALQKLGVKNFLVPLQIAAADYDSANPYKNPGTCNMPRGALPISEANLAKYRARLEANLKEMKKHGVNVIAFEIGNEINTACFNGDVPVRDKSQPPTDEEFRKVYLGYAKMIVAAAETVHRPEFYPNAKIVSAGIAGPRAKRYNGHNMPNPGRIIDGLRQVPYTGRPGKQTVFDLLDGIGIHYYANNPSRNSIEGVKLALEDLEADSKSGKPYWVTEWFPGRRNGPQDTNLYERFKSFYEAAVQAPVPVAAMYATNLGHARNPGYDLVDQNYNFFPDIRFFREVIPPSLTINANRASSGTQQGATIVWRAHNVVPNSCSVATRDGGQPIIVERADSGARPVGPSPGARDYTLTCKTFTGGTATKNVTISPN